MLFRRGVTDFHFFINLTPHTVNILLDNGDKITIPASGTIARVCMDWVKVDDIDGIPVFRTVFSKDIPDLPALADDTLFVVSTLVAQAAVGRDDLVVPANLIRDDNGVIIGASGFQVF